MTASELIRSLPQRMKTVNVPYTDMTVHFKISGEHGGNFTANVVNGTCTVQEGLTGIADCVVETKDHVYEDVEMGRANPQTAVLFGKIKVSSITSLQKFAALFERAVES